MNFSTWNALFLSVLNKHAPIKEKRVKRAKKSAWLTEEITAAQKNRDYYHKKQDWENFKLWRNKTKSLIRTAKKAFFENAINENNETIHSCPNMGATLCMGHKHAISVK